VDSTNLAAAVKFPGFEFRGGLMRGMAFIYILADYHSRFKTFFKIKIQIIEVNKTI
jgi:hypothetical protein